MTKDGLIESLMKNMPEDWESGEESPEYIVISYLRTLERRLEALGGNTGAHDGGQHAALGKFYAIARKHVTTDDVDDWNDMVDAWERYIKVKAAAE